MSFQSSTQVSRSPLSSTQNWNRFATEYLAMGKVAWRAAKGVPYWMNCFRELNRYMHSNQANVTIALHVLIMFWYVLIRHKPYTHYSPEQIDYKYLTWF
jgi:hypothetical protein